MESQGWIKLLSGNWHALVSLGSIFDREERCSVSERNTANQWHRLKCLKSRCRRPQVPWWCSWKLSFCKPWVPLEQTAGDSTGWWWWSVVETNDELIEWALNCLLAARPRLEAGNLPRIEQPFSRAPEVGLAGQSASTGWLLKQHKQHTPNLDESLRPKIVFLPKGSIACTYDVKHRFCRRLFCRLSPHEVTRKGCHQW